MPLPREPGAQVLAEVTREERNRVTLAPLLDVDQLVREESDVQLPVAADQDPPAERHRGHATGEQRHHDDAGTHPVAFGHVAEARLRVRRQTVHLHGPGAATRRRS